MGTCPWLVVIQRSERNEMQNPQYRITLLLDFTCEELSPTAAGF
jgi:hypothetical protein